MRPRDSQRARPYAAEREAWNAIVTKSSYGGPVGPLSLSSVGHEALLRDVQSPDGGYLQPPPESIDQFLARIQRTRWWRSRGYRPVTRDASYEGVTWSWGGSGVIHIARMHSHRWIVLHEVAHAVLPGDAEGHGPEFCRTYLDLVCRFIGKAEADLLRAAYRRNRVRYRRAPAGRRQQSMARAA